MRRRGQASVEYLLLLCSMLTVACLVGYFLKNYIDVLVDHVADRLLDAVFRLALG
ncbi:MAG: class III signal peptide-containing protein [Elusimicrobia bacterium]|nr:class III signal peptide-containing protein [Elusimicrobiota bacterium]